MKNLKVLEDKYAPTIQKIIDENSKYYGFSNKVQWEFFYDDNISIFGSSKKDFKLYLNLKAVIKAFSIDQPLHVELFILHEIRHIYQRFIVQLYQENPNNLIHPHAKLWNYEFSNYIDMNKNIELYYAQSIEFDAFTFSHAVIQYKYGVKNYIKKPSYYDIKFENAVSQWINIFKDNNL